MAIIVVLCVIAPISPSIWSICFLGQVVSPGAYTESLFMQCLAEWS